MLLVDAVHFFLLYLRPSPALVAVNIFLRKQLAPYQERHIKPRRVMHVTRMALIWLARWCNWRQAIVVVQPATLIRWHRQQCRLFWRWKSRSGPPPNPHNACSTIPTWHSWSAPMGRYGYAGVGLGEWYRAGAGGLRALAISEEPGHATGGLEHALMVVSHAFDQHPLLSLPHCMS
jgi:hypothetical protein